MWSNFYPRPPRGGRPNSKRRGYPTIYISIHALREEGDTKTKNARTIRNDFYPRPPRGGRPTRCSVLGPQKYFYPRPPRGGRLAVVGAEVAVTEISIHALREEGDSDWPAQFSLKKEFLSTPSARRATPARSSSSRHAQDFYPRPPRGGRLLLFQRILHSPVISIHALREEGDALRSCLRWLSEDFYPRPPRGGRHATMQR